MSKQAKPEQKPLPAPAKTNELSEDQLDQVAGGGGQPHMVGEITKISGAPVSLPVQVRGSSPSPRRRGRMTPSGIHHSGGIAPQDLGTRGLVIE